MALSVKIPFAGLFRGLFRQAKNPASASSTATHQLTPPTAPKHFVPTSASAISSAMTSPTSNDLPPSENEIEIPLAAIVSAMPMELRAKIMSAPPSDAVIRLQTDAIISQLGFGSVKISFGELRRLAPGLVANSGGEYDSRPVSLPLPEILARINPALLARRPGSIVSAADDIVGPFAERGRGINFTANPTKAPAPPDSFRKTQTTPTVAPQKFDAKPVAISPPITFNPRAITPEPSTPSPASSADNSRFHPEATIETSRFVQAKTPGIFVSLSLLVENWPLILKQEILQSPFAGANVALPEELVESGLKRGRVTMLWKQLRTLAAPDSPASPNDAVEVQLPLKIVAPLFLGSKKNLLPAQAKVIVKTDIPDLFFGFPQPAAATAIPRLPMLPKPQPGAPDTNYFVPAVHSQAAATEIHSEENVHTDFSSRQATPKEVVARALALPGVAGAVVALPDGLRVASEVPAELNPDTLAAFLPQIFERVNQSTRELRMGTLNNVSFTVGDVPWKIFRVRSVYFAAFGRIGESLPSAQLVQLAAEIDRKK